MFTLLFFPSCTLLKHPTTQDNSNWKETPNVCLKLAFLADEKIFLKLLKSILQNRAKLTTGLEQLHLIEGSDLLNSKRKEKRQPWEWEREREQRKRLQWDNWLGRTLSNYYGFVQRSLGRLGQTSSLSISPASDNIMNGCHIWHRQTWTGAGRRQMPWTSLVFSFRRKFAWRILSVWC